ncbi:MAG TPA: hypothetical protein VII98_08375 [Solirubrobacteraceae bacterium]
MSDTSPQTTIRHLDCGTRCPRAAGMLGALFCSHDPVELARIA